MPADKFITTYTGGEPSLDGSDKDIVSYIHSELRSYADARSLKEAAWLECWAAYLGTPQSIEHTRSQLLNYVGDVNNDWRHRINTGKAFENVETILSYLQPAFFPNRDWFDCVPTKPGYYNLADSIRKFVQAKLHQGKFISNWEMFLRQLLIIGNSCIALPWRYETTRWKKKVRIRQPHMDGMTFGEKYEYDEVEFEKVIQNHPDFETLDMFDVFVSPRACDPNQGNFIRRFYKTRAELAQCVKSGYFKGINYTEIGGVKAANYTYDQSQSNKDTIKHYQGLDVFSDRHHARWTDDIELFEFWGDVHLSNRTYHDVRAIVCGDRLLRFETNPYWAGKPFVVGNYIPVVRSPVGMGAIEPSLGLLHEMNIITNSRLDNLLISSNGMFEYVNDGSLQPDEVFAAPGKVFPVTQKGTITPIDMPNSFVITYEESSFLENRIDKNTGTGAFVSPGIGRTGERVTATEVTATQQAGGNRLSGVHKHIEETSLLPLLEKVFRSCQQFVVDDEIVSVPGQEPGQVDYVAIGVDELQNEFKLIPIGADHVVDKEYKLNKLFQFVQVSSQYPEMQKNLNYYNIQIDMARLMGLDEIERYIAQDVNPEPSSMMEMTGGGQTPQGQPPGSTGMDALLAEAARMGGRPMQDVVSGEIEADGGMTMLSEATGDAGLQMPILPAEGIPPA